MDPWRTDLFAPSSGANTSRIVDLVAVKRGHDTFIVDITCAFFHAPEEEECYVQPPQEWLEARPEDDRDVVWRLKKQLYGAYRKDNPRQPPQGQTPWLTARSLVGLSGF